MSGSRANPITALLILVLLLLLVLLVWQALRLLQAPNPLQQAAEAVGEGIEARLNPTPTVRPSPAVIIHQMQRISRLETASFTVEKVITAESGQDALAFLFGDRLLFVAHGQVIAGVDLGRMQQGDITVTTDDRVIVVLPPVEIFVVALDSERSYVVDRNTGLFGMNPGLETAARQAAEAEILNAALESGILQMAEENARAYMEHLILGFGFQEVIFVEAAPIPTPTPSLLPVTVEIATPMP